MSAPVFRSLGRCDYQETYERMREITRTRTESSPDEIWCLEHDPVFTQGQAGRAEHLLLPGDIPVVQSDRGGQVTYHGPGQLVVYFLLDLNRLGRGIRWLVTTLEQCVIDMLAESAIDAAARRDAPGVYVGGSKIASIGLRVRHGFTYHGIAINVAMDLEPFHRINPCGIAGLDMVQTSALGGPSSVEAAADAIRPILLERLVPAPVDGAAGDSGTIQTHLD